jgi:hypothetical protein
VIVSSLDGRVTDVIGNGEFGRADGTFEEAQFYRPQGLALDGDRLYIADTENHLVRVADLATRQVETVAGTGEAGRGVATGAPRGKALSRRGICNWRPPLFVAMAARVDLAIDLARLALRYAGRAAKRASTGR